jgi:hypothetical protein
MPGFVRSHDSAQPGRRHKALASYLQARTLAYGNSMPAARELANSTPATASEIVPRLMSAIEEALGQGRHAPAPGTGKNRLSERRAARA